MRIVESMRCESDKTGNAGGASQMPEGPRVSWIDYGNAKGDRGVKIIPMEQDTDSVHQPGKPLMVAGGPMV